MLNSTRRALGFLLGLLTVGTAALSACDSGQTAAAKLSLTSTVTLSNESCTQGGKRRIPARNTAPGRGRYCD